MSGWFDKDDDDNADDEGEDNFFGNGEDQLIFLIDAKERMESKNSQGEIQIVNCLKVALSVMKTKIVASSKASVGIIFFGCALKPNGLAKDIHKLFSLAPPSAERMRRLQDLIDDLDQFKEQIGFGKNAELVPLKEALWACMNEFSLRAKNKSSNDFKRIWIFTNEDDPNAEVAGAGVAEQELIIQVSKDCAQTDAEISLWHMNIPGKSSFDVDKFYTKVLSADEDELLLRVNGAANDGFDAMLAFSKRKEMKKRRLCSIKFNLGPGTKDTAAPSSSSIKDAFGEMQVEIFKLIAPAKKSSSIYIHSSTNLPLKSVSIYVDEEGRRLHDENMKLYLDYAGSRVYFTKSEFMQEKNLGLTENTLNILYFIDAKAITGHPEYNIQNPYFIVPNEKQVKGSSALFYAILDRMINNGVIAIGIIKMTSVTAPKLVAIIPQKEEIDEDDGIQIIPGGMNLVILPWQQDMRNSSHVTNDNQMVAEAKTMVSKDMVDAAVGLSKNWQFEVTTGRPITGIENPSIQCFYGGLQAIALNQPISEWDPERDDQMKMSFVEDSMKQKVEESVQTFKATIGFPENDEPEVKPKKRAPASGESAVKRVKVEGDLSTFSLEDLKQKCRDANLKISGNKSQLIERLTSEA